MILVSAATAHGDGGTDVLTTNANVVQRFLQRGVQIGNDENVNTANESYVLWQWLLGESATTGSSITTGSPSLATTGVVSDANHFSLYSTQVMVLTMPHLHMVLGQLQILLWLKELLGQHLTAIG